MQLQQSQGATDATEATTGNAPTSIVTSIGTYGLATETTTLIATTGPDSSFDCLQVTTHKAL